MYPIHTCRYSTYIDRKLDSKAPKSRTYPQLTRANHSTQSHKSPGTKAALPPNP